MARVAESQVHVFAPAQRINRDHFLPWTTSKMSTSAVAQLIRGGGSSDRSFAF
jgi:hypothetical protein